MDALNFEPFPRQVLMGGPGGPVAWYSPTFDVAAFKTIAWEFNVSGSLPGSVSNPATLDLETSNDFNGPWEDMIPGGSNPNVGFPATGAVVDPGKFLRARVSIIQDELSMISVRCVARRR